MSVEREEGKMSAFYLESYLNALESLPIELERNFSLMRKLDDRAQVAMRNIDFHSKDLLKKLAQRPQPLSSADRKERVNDISLLFGKVKELSDDKVQLAIQTYELVDKQIRRLDNDLARFEGEIQEKAKAAAASASIHDDSEEEEQQQASSSGSGSGKKSQRSKTGKNNSSSSTSNSKGTGKDGKGGKAASRGTSKKATALATSSSSEEVDEDDNDDDAEEPKEEKKQKEASASASKPSKAKAAPPAKATKAAAANKNKKKQKGKQQAKEAQKAGGKKSGEPEAGDSDKEQSNDDSSHPTDVLDMPVDPNEPTYCLCHQVSYGEMIGCDNPDCPIEWFHFACVGLKIKPKGKWFCPKCGSDRKKK